MLLPAVSPMSVKFIGHPITNGDVALDLDYDIADRYLKASNVIEADDLELGDKVEGEGMINLPFKLGVSLLKDKEGRITLDIPFEGSFDTPGFGMASAAGAAFSEIFTQLVSSPFKLLGKIGGGGGDQDLQFVEFAAGSAALEDRATQNLDVLGRRWRNDPRSRSPSTAAPTRRPTRPAFARPLSETRCSREAYPRRTSTSTIPIEVLESMFAERISTTELDALRAQHTAAPAEGGEPSSTRWPTVGRCGTHSRTPSRSTRPRWPRWPPPVPRRFGPTWWTRAASIRRGSAWLRNPRT